ncbi:MAG: hypothetical protein QGG34_14150 [SAR202 cluster bacterium]|jgi:hypothetical protein|nr:hypothetical protein [SAR202 cluster bacterium]MDP7414793.1 hypothetical protein [SAR202 cluster bacterium]HJO82172.1 hypothetical protein [SAR202 cluster bacterium]
MHNSNLDIHRITADQFAEYAKLSIAFTVESVLSVDLVDGGLGGVRLRGGPSRLT